MTPPWDLGGRVERRRGTGRQSRRASRSILEENAAKDQTLIDARGLKAALCDVASAIHGLLQEAKVELALATDIVGDRLGDLGEGSSAGGVKDLGGAGCRLLAYLFVDC